MSFGVVSAGRDHGLRYWLPLLLMAALMLSPRIPIMLSGERSLDGRFDDLMWFPSLAGEWSWHDRFSYAPQFLGWPHFRILKKRSLDVRAEDMVAVVAAIWFLVSLRTREGKSFLASGTVKLWMVFLALGGISTVLGYLSRRIGGWVPPFYWLKEFEYFLFFWVFSRAGHNAVRWIRRLLPYTAGLSALISFVLFAAGVRSTSWYGVVAIVETGKMPVASYFGVLGIACAVLALYGAGRSRWVSGAATALCFAAAASTLSRTTATLIGGSLLFLLGGFAWRHVRFRRRFPWLAVGLSISLLLVAALSVPLLIDRSFPLLRYLRDMPRAAAIRWNDMWMPLIRSPVWTKSWLFGLGKAYGDKTAFDSLYVKLLVETGVVGLMIWLVLLGVLLYEASKRGHSAESEVWWHMLSALVPGFLLSGFSAEGMFLAKAGGLFWAFAGMAMGYVVDSRNEEDGRS